MMALVDGIQPRVLGLQDILQEHIKHRQLWFVVELNLSLRKAQETSTYT